MINNIAIVPTVKEHRISQRNYNEEYTVPIGHFQSQAEGASSYGKSKTSRRVSTAKTGSKAEQSSGRGAYGRILFLRFLNIVFRVKD